MKKELKKIIAALLVISIVFNAGIFVVQAKTIQEGDRVAKKETESPNTYLLSAGSKRIDI